MVRIKFFAGLRGAWAPVLAAASLLAIAIGTRSSMGQFIGPINTSTALGAATISFALAASQLAWGVAQPVCGYWAQRIGIVRVVAAGGVLTAFGLALLATARDASALIATMLLIGTAGAAAGGAPLLMGAVTQRVAPARRGLAIGIVSAGGSIGQLLVAPLVALLLLGGWQMAVLVLAALSLAAVPLSRCFRSPPRPDALDAGPRVGPVALTRALREADYWCVTAGFFVCGFHVSLLTTHMPGVIELCGFPASFSGLWLAVVGACNIGSSLIAGALMQRLPMKWLLSGLYALRALGVALFVVAPKTEAVMLAFAVWMGLTYMATLPPTTGLIAALYGTRHLATLFGITMACHQAGSFLGAWFGGLELEWSGAYRWVWIVDIALATGAALIHLPVREARGTPAVSGARANLAGGSAR